MIRNIDAATNTYGARDSHLTLVSPTTKSKLVLFQFSLSVYSRSYAVLSHQLELTSTY